jgi:tRNA(adenine34) deaminase
MILALEQAGLAERQGEVPVGAVVLDAGARVLAVACNQTLRLTDPAGHAEMLALREAAVKVGNHRLSDAVLVVTLEPCLMCLGAMIQARIKGLVFGARDPKAGAVLSRLNVNDLHWLNHRFWVMEGVLAEECGKILHEFFQARRKVESLFA